MLAIHGMPPQDLLVATDLSPGAALALARAAQLPARAGARIVLLHVLDVANIPRDERAAARDDAAAELCVLAARHAGAGRAIEIEIARGDASSTILDRAHAHGAGMIVVGRHGHGARRGRLIGRTIHRLIRLGDLPTLVVRAPAAAPYRRPLIATGLDDQSPRVVATAFRVLDDGVDEIELLHARPIPFEGIHALWRSERLARAIDDAVRDQLAELADATHVPADRRALAVRHHEPRRSILDELATGGFDLVAIGSNERGALARLASPGVAEAVVAAAGCDVLVVPDPTAVRRERWAHPAPP